jgi:alcohol dehydrogenase (cytochrome c)
MSKLKTIVACVAIPFGLGSIPVHAQVQDGVDPASFALMPVDSWPTYHGDYSGRRHSTLTQVTPDNVHTLTLAWVFRSNPAQSIKGTPIVHDGIMYVTVVDNLWALDARTGREIWRYQYPQNSGFRIGHRGVAIAGNSVYLTTRDAHLLSLNAIDGSVQWEVEIADSDRGYWSTNAPLVIDNNVIVGVSGDFDNLPGMLKSFDTETGKLRWTFYSTPPPGTPDSISGGATGGQMWMTGTYDPELDLMYVGTGNPTPVLNGQVRPGDNKWTGSIVALKPDTGELVWGFQIMPHDTHDWDAAEVPVLVDAELDGVERKLLMQASRNGYFAVLDRETGKNLLTRPFARVNWAERIASDGRPIPDPDKEPAPDGRLVSPDEGGGTNYRSPSLDPEEGLLIVSAADAFGLYFWKPEHGDYGWAGASPGVYSHGYLRAIDFRTGEIRWEKDLHGGAGAAGVLTTATGVTFTGDSASSAVALRTRDGATLWHSRIGRVGNSPITYELDGRQYVIFGGGDSVYAFVMPQRLVAD